MATKLSPSFEKAVKDSRQLKEKPTNDELLQLYGLFKQASQSPAFEKAEKPGMFDLKGKYKYQAWQKLNEEGVTPQESQTKYVALVEQLKGIYGFDPNKKPE
ncbi:hypothetical protein MMC20_001784 [Loxospora ochrophaea]|nr:hypothetical protein [Loxospora ochrophaea]